MNARERFIAAMHYRERDRCPICDFSFWSETIEIWKDQGLPAEVTLSNTNEYFGMDPLWRNSETNPGLCPGFGWKVLEDRGDHEVIQQNDGVRVLRKKFMGSIPHHLGHLLTDRASWEKHYKPRLDPSHPDRVPKDAEDYKKRHAPEKREAPLSLWCGSLYGCLRDWMGMENLSYLVYDDPALFEEMVTTLADCSIATLEWAFSTGLPFDGANFWEDMCYNSGPLLSPEHFKKYLVPQYKRVTEILYKNGVDVVWLDCDGKIDELAPLWLDAGVNCMFPIEVGTWRADPLKFRKEYGKDMLLIGGVDKHILAQNPEAIAAEVNRLTPLVEEGGYIPLPDHRVPPDVPLKNYLFYLEQARAAWGKNTNLNPLHPAILQLVKE